MTFSVAPITASQVASIRRQSGTATEMAGRLSEFAQEIAKREQVHPEAVLTGFFKAGLVFWSEQEHTPLQV